MVATIIDGRLVALELLGRVQKKVRALKKSRRAPLLAFIFAGDNESSSAYVHQKKKACEKVGISYREFLVPKNISTKKIITMIERLNKDSTVDGILVQLPLPPQVSEKEVIRAIAPHKDVDGFHAINMGEMLLHGGDYALTPATPTGVMHLLDYYKIPLSGAEVVVIGRSNIVGKPLAAMLINRSATVTVCHSKTRDLSSHTRRADIVCVAVGVPGLLKGNMIKRGCTVIDVGFTRREGKIFGDVDFASVMKKASFITPVPGGVGPMTVACLMDNVVKAALRGKKALR